MDYFTLIGGILQEVLGLASTATSGQVQNIINIIDKSIPYVEQLGPGLLQSLQNVITELSGNASVTAAQLQQLQQQSTVIDSALDAAAKDDGLSG